jgi:hypothetical protein
MTLKYLNFSSGDVTKPTRQKYIKLLDYKENTFSSIHTGRTSAERLSSETEAQYGCHQVAVAATTTGGSVFNSNLTTSPGLPYTTQNTMETRPCLERV